MKKAVIPVLLSIVFVFRSYSAGTVFFSNSVFSQVYLVGGTRPQWAPPGVVDPTTFSLASPIDNVFAQLLYFPEGLMPTYDNLNSVQSIGTPVQVGIPLPGRFSGGMLTVPTAIDGGVANLCVRLTLGTFGQYGHSYSEIFTVDTGDPTANPTGSPGSVAASLTQPMMIGRYLESLDTIYPPYLVPEPSVFALGATISVVFTSRGRKLINKPF